MGAAFIWDRASSGTLAFLGRGSLPPPSQWGTAVPLWGGGGGLSPTVWLWPRFWGVLSPIFGGFCPPSPPFSPRSLSFNKSLGLGAASAPHLWD